MRRTIITFGIATIAIVIGFASRAEPGPISERGVVDQRAQLGRDETILLVIGAWTDDEVAAAARRDELNASMGELQGFYTDDARHYRFLGTYERRGGASRPTALRLTTGAPSSRQAAWLVATAFRTTVGAESFIDMARAYGVEGLEVVRAHKRGGAFVGLGQEPHPDGHGALLAPLRDPARFQR